MNEPIPLATFLAALSKADLKAWADNEPVPVLPDEPESYFELDQDGTILIALSELRTKRDPEEDADSVHRAMVFAAAAREGHLPKRAPITVAAEGGAFLILDGTSTYGAAVRAGWRTIPARIVEG